MFTWDVCLFIFEIFFSHCQSIEEHFIELSLSYWRSILLYFSRFKFCNKIKVLKVGSHCSGVAHLFIHNNLRFTEASWQSRKMNLYFEGLNPLDLDKSIWLSLQFVEKLQNEWVFLMPLLYTIRQMELYDVWCLES